MSLDPVVAAWLDRAAAEVEQVAGLLNATNLFPVPDADTGTNLLVTLKAAARGAHESGLPGAVHAALMEAAGNSGVIVSEMLRGLAQEREQGWAAAWIAAHHAASAAVSAARTGTILSVSSAMADAAAGHTGSDSALASALWQAARAAALDTAQHPPIPDALGTVDAGAHGLERIAAAFAALFADGDCAALPVTLPTRGASPAPQKSGLFEVMYLLRDCDAHGAARLRHQLSELGDSVLVVGDEQMWNVHVHLADPGAAVDAGLGVGRPHRVRITALEPSLAQRTVIVVSNGPGLTDILGDSGARVIDASGGRRPDAHEFVIAGEGAREAILLPHDRRSLEAASSAVEALRHSGVRVAVLPTKSTVQVLAALAVHDPYRSFDDDVVAMTAAAGHTRFATIASALRDGLTAAGPAAKGDVLGLIHGEVVVVGHDLLTVTRDVADRLMASGGELLTLISGQGSTPELMTSLTDHVKLTHPQIDIQVIDGGQHYYPVLIGVE